MAESKAKATLTLEVKKEGDKDAFSGLTIGLAAVAAGAAAVTGAIAYTVAAFAEADEASKSLDQALKAAGKTSDGTRQRYDELANGLQKVTKFEGDAATAAFAAGQAFLGNKEITKELARTAADFAAGTGSDFKEAFEKITKSIGTNTNVLARNGVELSATMTAEEKQAQILDVLKLRYGGMAEAQAKSLGTLPILKNEFGDLAEEIGRQFAPAVVSAIAGLRDIIAVFSDIVSSAGPAFSNFLISAVGEMKALGVMAGALGDLIATGFSPAKVVRVWGEMQDKLVAVDADTTTRLIKNKQEYFLKQQPLVKKMIDDEKDAADKVVDEERKAAQKRIDARTALSKAREEQIKRDEDKEKKFIQLLIDLNKKEAQQKEAEAERLFQADMRREQEEYEELKRLSDARTRDIVATTNATLSGGMAAGAAQVVTIVGEIWLPGFGGLIGQAFGMLSGPVDKFREQLTAMFDPSFLANLAENLTVFMEETPEMAANFLQYITDHMGEIVQKIIRSFIENLPELFFQALTQMFFKPEFYVGVAKGIINGIVEGLSSLRISEIVGGFGDIFGSIFKSKVFSGAYEGIRDGIHTAFSFMDVDINHLYNQVAEAIRRAVVAGFTGGLSEVNIGGTGGDLISKIGNIFKFAHGGMVPAYAHGGAHLDGVAARLTPGEFVVNPKATSANMGLLQAINQSNGRQVQGGGGSNITIVVNGGMMGDPASAQEFARALDRELLLLRQRGQALSF